MNDRAGFIGQSVERKEDYRFLTGAGQYTDDITLPHQSVGYFLRSPHAHARLRSIDIAAAKAAPGVLGVFTGKDMASVGGLPCGWQINNIDGTPMKEPKHAVLAENKVCYVGDHVALVVAETLAQAKDAANLIDFGVVVLARVLKLLGVIALRLSRAQRLRDREHGRAAGVQRPWGVRCLRRRARPARACRSPARRPA